MAKSVFDAVFFQQYGIVSELQFYAKNLAWYIYVPFSIGFFLHICIFYSKMGLTTHFSKIYKKNFAPQKTREKMKYFKKNFVKKA